MNGRDHYFYFTIEFSKTEAEVRQFKYLKETIGKCDKIEI